jgi:NADH-quinone oxidoreductase subunit J
MNASLIGFGILAVISVATALGVILSQNALRSALCLVVNFLCLAFLYLLLNAQVLAFLQILVYAGAIMVLFLFVIMLLNLGGEGARTDPLVGQKLVGFLLGGGLLWGLIKGINYAAHHGLAMTEGGRRVATAEQSGVSQIQIIGWDMFTRYVYPFELTSILLLVGAIGVMLLTRYRPLPGTGDASSHS